MIKALAAMTKHLEDSTCSKISGELEESLQDQGGGALLTNKSQEDERGYIIIQSQQCHHFICILISTVSKRKRREGGEERETVDYVLGGEWWSHLMEGVKFLKHCLEKS